MHEGYGLELRERDRCREPADSLTDTASDTASDIAPNGDTVSADVQADVAVDAVTDTQVDAVADQETREPDCEGLQCGDDGCGGYCGECQTARSARQAPAVPPCEDGLWDDGCVESVEPAPRRTPVKRACVSGQTQSRPR